MTDHRFHFFDIIPNMSQAEAIKTQLVHCLQHTWMREVTLERNMTVMTYEIRFARKHVHQETFTPEMAVKTQVNFRIDGNNLDDLFTFSIRIILRKRQVVRSTEDDHRFARIVQIPNNHPQCGKRIVQSRTDPHIANVGDRKVAMPIEQLVKFPANFIRSMNT